MRVLWIHSAVEQLQHLIVRRTIGNATRQEVYSKWTAIQMEMNEVLQEMDKEYDIHIDALQTEKKARDQSVLGHNGGHR